MPALIVTAWVHDDDLYSFHALRERFFPRNRTFVSAHVTLFHHLPGCDREEVIHAVGESVSDYRATHLPHGADHVAVDVRNVFHMGRGVAYALDPTALTLLRRPIERRFEGRLTPQDAAAWRTPHITIQNKVTPQRSKQLYRHLKHRFEPCGIRVLGLQVWRYVSGPWAHEADFGFAEAPKN